MNLLRKILFLFLIAFCFQVLTSQNKKWLDSTLNVLKSTKTDSTKVTALVSLSVYEIRYGSLDGAEKYCNEAVNLAKRISYLPGLADALHNLGVINLSQAKFTQAMEYYLQALKVKNEIGDEGDKASTLSSIGTIYSQQGDRNKAFEYYFKALEIYEKAGKSSSAINTLNNIGLLFIANGEDNKALIYLKRAANICDSIQQKKDFTYPIVLSNMADIYQRGGQYEKALELNKKALGLQYALNNKRGLGMTYYSFGDVYYSMGNYDKALEQFKIAMLYSDSADDKLNQVIELSGLGRAYYKLNKLKESETYLLKAQSLGENINGIEPLQFVYEYLSYVYEKQNQPAKALKVYKKFVQYRDSMFNLANSQKQMQSEMNYELQKKESEFKAVNEKNQLIAAQEKKKQDYVILLVCLGLLFTLLLTIIIFISLQKNKKKNKIIELQKLEVEIKQKEVMDSIHYAKRIQSALMPNEKYIERILKGTKK